MYYRMDWKVDFAAQGFEMVATGKTPVTGVPWTMGVRYPKPVPQPIRIPLDKRSGPVMPDLLAGLPIFSARLVEVLQTAGVNNLDLYETEVVDEVRNKTYTHFKAVNIIGRVSCADLTKSVSVSGHSPPLMEFEKLVIDESKTMGLPMFRLAEAVQMILVSETVKQAISDAKVMGVRVVSLDDPSAY
ncbi:imm11 family protein [Myxococcus sp. 1LA]